jgi:type II secretory pathway component PulJ
MEARAVSGRTRRARKSSILPSELGFSIVELIIGMTLMLVLMTVTASMFQAVVRGASIGGTKDEARADGRLVMRRLERNLRVTGLRSPLDVDGTSDDISRDVPGMAWSDSIAEDFEFAQRDELVLMADCNNDSITETVRIWRNGLDLHETVWQWRRDSVKWGAPVHRLLSDNAERLIFFYYDPNGNPLPGVGVSGTLTAAERWLVSQVEMVLVMRSAFEDKQRPYYTSFPDGTYTCDGYLRFWLTSRISGRNL